MNKVIYIAGPMDGTPKFWEAFDKAEEQLIAMGKVVLNPALLPEGLDYERYIPICLAMVAAADAVLLLPGWEKSKGAMAEHAFAKAMGKEIWDAEAVVG